MGRKKSIIKPKEPIKLRWRQLKNGNQTIYLDYYEKGRGYELAERYRFQLEKYGQAIEKITGKRVKEKYLYLFNHNDVEKIEN